MLSQIDIRSLGALIISAKWDLVLLGISSHFLRSLLFFIRKASGLCSLYVAKSHDDEWFLQVENRISMEVDADITETIVKLNQSRTAYQAALQTGVDLFSLSLLQYI